MVLFDTDYLYPTVYPKFCYQKLSVLCYQLNTKKAVPPNTLAPYTLSQLAEKNYPLQEL